MRLLFTLMVWLLALPTVTLSQTDPEVSFFDEVRIAILSEDFDQLKKLASTGIDLMFEDGTPLIIVAATQGSPKILELLVNQGVNPNTLDISGYSAVMRALEVGRIDNAKKLQDLGATLKGITKDGYTVRLLAERVGLNDFGPIYASSGEFKIEKKAANGILLTAAEAGDLPAVMFAITNGANSGVKADNRWTPLMLAALGGHNDVFRYLLKINPSSNSITYSVDGVNVVIAALVGMGGAEQKNVVKMLKTIKRVRPQLLKTRSNEYRAIVLNLDYSTSIRTVLLAFFPANYAPLPAIENKLPFGSPPTPEGWRQVQRTLMAEGLYKGKIDGKPGPMTYRALYAYHRPMIDELRKNALIAGERAKGLGFPEPDQAQVYGQSFLRYSYVSKGPLKINGQFSTTKKRLVLNGYGVAISRKSALYFYGLSNYGSPLTQIQGIYMSERRVFNKNYPISRFYSHLFDGDYVIEQYKDKTVYYILLNSKKIGLFTIHENNSTLGDKKRLTALENN